ncbi:MAG: CinA family protein [Gammaproteobacteria bacterium]|nr:CinA family protein [Gammaproteobacteria bacterium]NNF48374.1 CinA family protein [Woeseiaceae bacterium]MBT8093593.1 CinA family protein [Gammaproteobacteria bacterium]MBT8104290.1 CinA family protein [Gammaproteobacteria bacterium]NNK24305.1 CinA family protein [Woeseiaceae bacterium]
MADYESLRKLSEAVVHDLTEAGKAVATAESCTGGWIAKSITDVAGSSAVFAYGIVSYSNGAKESILGVQNATIDRHGAVSEEVVEEMADGVLHLSGADIAVAVSGIAGPGGGTDDKPVGTVWFAWAVRDGADALVDTRLENFDGDRELVRELTVAHAMQGLLERIA